MQVGLEARVENGSLTKENWVGSCVQASACFPSLRGVVLE